MEAPKKNISDIGTTLNTINPINTINFAINVLCNAKDEMEDWIDSGPEEDSERRNKFIEDLTEDIETLKNEKRFLGFELKEKASPRYLSFIDKYIPYFDKLNVIDHGPLEKRVKVVQFSDLEDSPYEHVFWKCIKDKRFNPVLHEITAIRAEFDGIYLDGQNCVINTTSEMEEEKLKKFSFKLLRFFVHLKGYGSDIQEKDVLFHVDYIKDFVY